MEQSAFFAAVGGVEPQSETVWRQSEHFGVPKLVLINKMDRSGADFSGVLKALRERLGANPLAVNIPLGEGESFQGIIDLISLCVLEFSQEDQGVSVKTRKLTEEENPLALSWRDLLLEGLADIGVRSWSAILTAISRKRIFLTPCGGPRLRAGHVPFWPDRLCAIQASSLCLTPYAATSPRRLTLPAPTGVKNEKISLSTCPASPLRRPCF